MIEECDWPIEEVERLRGQDASEFYDFDDYGPTMDQPLPDAHTRDRVIDVNGGRDERELIGTGLAPEDFENDPWYEYEVRADEPSWGLAAGEDADMAFIQAEEERLQEQREQALGPDPAHDWGPLEPAPPASGYERADVIRYDSTGRFAGEPPAPEREWGNFRDAHSGQFMGQGVSDPLIDREPRTGRFDKPRDGERRLGGLFDFV